MWSDKVTFISARIHCLGSLSDMSLVRSGIFYVDNLNETIVSFFYTKVRDNLPKQYKVQWTVQDKM